MLSLAPHSRWGLALAPPKAGVEQKDGGHHFLWLFQCVGDKGLLPECSSPPLTSPAWPSRREHLFRRDSSFGHMGPKDPWDLGCLKCR